jgi:hypothetical protein
MWRESLRDWDRLRATLREDLASARARVPRWIRATAWLGLALGWYAVGLPLVALPSIVLFEAFVIPALGRPAPRELGPLREWHPPASFVISPESLPRDVRL